MSVGSTRSIRAILEMDTRRYEAGAARAKGVTRAFTAQARTELGRTEAAWDKLGKGVNGGGQYVAGMTKAKGASRDLTGSLLNDTGKQRQAWDDLGRTALLAGGGIAGGLGLATREAINWESAWAGVTKTTEGSDAQMAELEEQLRGLTKVLPATHEEIAGVAEAAGALGIARGDLVKFTEVAIGLGESTNLSAEDAATGLAKIANVMGTFDDEGVVGIERMGSALVALGNDGASTESDILSMAQRLSGAGDLIGATESDILAMSSALSSVGIEAELGGGAMSRGLQLMNTAVIEGDEKLQLFAKTAGMTADEFATAWRENPVAAANEFIAGLGRVSESGGDAAEVLNDVGLRGTQNAQVFLRAAGASKLLTEQIKLGSDAYAENTALQDEAQKRYETTASKMQIAQNGLRDAAIDAGSVLAPLAASGAEKIAGLADAFVKLPEPVKTTTTAVAGLTAGTLLFGSAGIKVAGWTNDLKTSLDDLGMMTPKVEAGFTKAGKAAKAAGIIFATAAATGKGIELFQGKAGDIGVEQMTKQMLDGADAVDVLDRQLSDTSVWLGSVTPRVDSFGRALEVAFDPSLMNSWQGKADSAVSALSLGMVDLTSDADEAARAFETIDRQLTGLVQSGQQDLADSLLSQYVKQANEAGVSTEDFMKKLPGLTEAQAAQANQAKLSGDATGGYADELDEVEVAAEDAADKIKELADAIRGLGGGFRDERGAARDMREAIRGIGEVAGKSADEQEAAFDDAAQASLDYIATLAEGGASEDELAAATRRARKAYVDKISAVTGNRDAARKLADAQGLVVPEVVSEYRASGVEQATTKTRELKKAQDDVKPVVKTSVSVPGAKDARSEMQRFYDSLTNVPPERKTKVSAPGATEAKTQTDFFNQAVRAIFPSKETRVSAPGATGAKGDVDKVTGAVLAIPPSKSVLINANTGPAQAAIAAIQAGIAAIPPVKTITVTTQHVEKRASGGIDLFTGGRHIQAFAGGGTFDPDRKFDTTLGRMQPGIKPVTTRGILMAEEGAGPWEAFISGHPAKAPRSKAIASEVVRMLGGQVSWDADGRLVEAFASGGVYGNWQAQLRKVQRLKRQYRKTLRFEDGSSKVDDPISIFEDGTARWSGYYGAPGSVASAIARLNAAQDAYEAAKRNPPQRQYNGNHSEEYKRKRAAQQERARTRAARMGGSGDLEGGWPGSQHSEEFKRTRRAQLWRARTREDRMARARAERWGRHYVSGSSPSAGSARGGQITRGEARMIGQEIARYLAPELQDAVRGRARAQEASVQARQRTGGSGRL